MAIVHSVPSEKSWESLFQTLVKALRTQEAEETVLVFDNYNNNQEFFLNQQERTNRVTNVRYYKSAYVRKLPKMSQGKVYKQYLEKTENFAELVDRFWKIHPARPQTLKRKGNVLFISRDVTYRVNSSELKTLFTSNHEKAETKIVCCCSSFNKLCIVKAKDTNLTLFNFDDLCIYSSTTEARLVHSNRQRFSC